MRIGRLRRDLLMRSDMNSLSTQYGELHHLRLELSTQKLLTGQLRYDLFKLSSSFWCSSGKWRIALFAALHANLMNCPPTVCTRNVIHLFVVLPFLHHRIQIRRLVASNDISRYQLPCVLASDNV